MVGRKQEFIDTLRSQEGIPKLKDVEIPYVITKHMDRMSAHCVHPESMILSVRFLEYFLKHYWIKDHKFPKQQKELKAKLKKNLHRAKKPNGLDKKMELEARYVYYMEIFSLLVEVMDRHNLLGQKETFDIIADYDDIEDYEEVEE